MYLESHKKYYEKNKKEIKERAKQYYQDNKIEKRAKQKQIYIRKKFGINTQEPTFTIRYGSFSPFS